MGHGEKLTQKLFCGIWNSINISTKTTILPKGFVNKTSSLEKTFQYFWALIERTNKYFAPCNQTKAKLTDADLLEVGDPSGAGGVGVVRHGRARHRGAALSASSLIVKQHRQTTGTRVTALSQTLIGDTDVIPGRELRHCPPVVGDVHHLLIGGGEAVQGTVAKVAGGSVAR